MDPTVEHEICGNCKKEIPHYNYVMHTAHCARNISLCAVCKEPVPKNQIEEHRKQHTTNVEKVDFPRQVMKSASTTYRQTPVKPKEPSKPLGQYTTDNEDTGYGFRRPSQRPADTAYGLRRSQDDARVTSGQDRAYGSSDTNGYGLRQAEQIGKTGTERKQSKSGYEASKPKQSSSLLACKYCDLELPKLELEDHENYCGARTDKCNECGEIVMYKYKKLHEETNHGFLKLSDEPGPRPTWDSDTQRPSEPSSYIRRQRPEPIYTVNSFDFSPLYSSYANYSSSSLAGDNNGEKRESYRDISRRLDCKTEYIRNLLHDSASITVPLRRNGITPRNHFNHNKGPAPQPPHRRPNPPTELVIPCEFCHTPVPHEDLIQHETGCRPDLARFNARRRSPSPDDDYFVPPAPSSPEVELPCEFCADMFPASQLLRHQATCT